MVRVTSRTAAKLHECGCGRWIRRGDRYVELVASPDHGDLGNTGWWRIAECSECATRYGRMQ